MATNSKPQKRTPAVSAVDKLFADMTQSTRDALALHKAEKRANDRRAFQERQGIRPDIET